MIFKWLAVIAFVISIADFIAGAHGEAIILMIVAGVLGVIAYSRNVPCMTCMSRIHRHALVCPHCGTDTHQRRIRPANDQV